MKTQTIPPGKEAHLVECMSCQGTGVSVVKLERLDAMRNYSMSSFTTGIGNCQSCMGTGRQRILLKIK